MIALVPQPAQAAPVPSFNITLPPITMPSFGLPQAAQAAAKAAPQVVQLPGVDRIIERVQATPLPQAVQEFMETLKAAPAKVAQAAQAVSNLPARATGGGGGRRELVDFMGSVDIRPALTPFATQLANARALVTGAQARVSAGGLSASGVQSVVKETLAKVQAVADVEIKNPVPLVVREPGQQAAQWGHALLAFIGDALYKAGTLYYVRKPLQDALFGGGG